MFNGTLDGGEHRIVFCCRYSSGMYELRGRLSEISRWNLRDSHWVLGCSLYRLDITILTFPSGGSARQLIRTSWWKTDNAPMSTLHIFFSSSVTEISLTNADKNIRNIIDCENITELFHNRKHNKWKIYNRLQWTQKIRSILDLWINYYNQWRSSRTTDNYPYLSDHRSHNKLFIASPVCVFMISTFQSSTGYVLIDICAKRITFERILFYYFLSVSLNEPRGFDIYV